MKKIIALILAGIIAASTAAMVSAEEEIPEEAVELARGVVFTEESGIQANTYTGLVGISAGQGIKGAQLLEKLENANGIEFRRDDAKLENDAELKNYDKIVLLDDTGAVKAEFDIILMLDANNDTVCTLADASVMLKKIAGWDGVEMCELAADVDGNGKVDLTDVSTFLKVLAGWEVETVTQPVLPGQGSDVISNYIMPYDVGEQSALNLRKGQDLAFKFSVGEGLYAKSVVGLFPSWNDSKGSIRLSLYKWDTDYETTVSAMPIVTEVFDGYPDNATIIFDLTDSAGKGLGEGEYLWRAHEGFDERLNPDDSNEPVGIGVWTYAPPAADSGITVFFEGEAIDPEAEGAFGPGVFVQVGK